MTTSSEKFLEAARRGDTAALREGASWKDYDRPDERGMTPAMWAAASGHVESLKVLAERGASVSRCDYFGRSALHHAAGNGHVGCVVFLVAFGANIWSLDGNFNTPLDVAAVHNRMAVVRCLDKAAADQMSGNIKAVKKQRDTAIRDAEKRARRLHKSHHELEMEGLEGTQLNSNRFSQGHSDPEGRTGTSPSYVSLTLSSSLSGRSAFSELKPYSSSGAPSAAKNFPYSTYFEINVPSNSSHSAYPSNGTANSNNNEKNGSLWSALTKKLQRKPRYLSRFTSEPVLSGESEPTTVGLRASGGGTAENGTSKLHPLDINAEYPIPRNDGIFRPGQQQPRPSTPFHTRDSADIVIHHVDESLDMETVCDSPTDEQLRFRRHAHKNTVNHAFGVPNTMSIGAKHLNPPASNPFDQISVPETIQSVISVSDNQKSGTTYKPNRNTETAVPVRFSERIGSGLEAFLQAYGLLEYITVLTREKLDMNSLILVNDLDLKDLGLPLGPRRVLLNAVAKRRDALSDPGRISDTMF